ncbi:MAG: hypothetical protein ACRDYX_04850 [Egibacteraceae bacterium]
MRSAVSAADAERSSACQDVFDYLGNEAAFVPIAHPAPVLGGGTERARVRGAGHRRRR